ncbi:ABC transporter ATP-binding protein [Nocardia sp. CDC159]|uniref:ABC transporter ATP-binding protein n=1 Tax=Nocardia pulmonis TaxID=2951408 RepID=A0A9X2IWA4_9NOCA|nr:MULTISPECIES: ABC transporter ATP-binding protein [Nocardia]MCM6774727.1 ABC transporter ATP-binding protein [Nocardia pulmonis]MCM6787208.1 ABC transporter ATP-binding protein [Nocardia sp. CDC159]
MLEVSSLSHSYRKGADIHPALADLTFSVARGELVSIVGPSGCGKSTLLRAIAGLLRFDEGRVIVDGTPVTGVPDELAIVFQDYSRSLFPWLDAVGNVALPLRRRFRSRRQRRDAALDALAAVGLSEVAQRHPWQLSGGMQQRVAIARAIAYEPKLLLMDEPFGSVDAQTREDLEDLILRLRDQREITIVFVTHDIDESVYVGDRVLALSRAPGRVIADLPVELPRSRDQIATKQLPGYIRLRAEVGVLIRGNPASRAVRSRSDGRIPVTDAAVD